MNELESLIPNFERPVARATDTGRKARQEGRELPVYRLSSKNLAPGQLVRLPDGSAVYYDDQNLQYAAPQLCRTAHAVDPGGNILETRRDGVSVMGIAARQHFEPPLTTVYVDCVGVVEV